MYGKDVTKKYLLTSGLKNTLLREALGNEEWQKELVCLGPVGVTSHNFEGCNGSNYFKRKKGLIGMPAYIQLSN
jgi:hypothetical protein